MPTTLSPIAFPVAVSKPACGGAAGFSLPADHADSVLILPVSGGADSTWLAILLHRMFPEVKFHMVFTDTLAEDPEIPLSLDRLEVYLGRKIERLKPEMGLFELIDAYNGFLPSAQARWCTRELKLVGFKKWMEQFKGQKKYVFVGVRADESQRIAFTIDECETLMPFIDMGVRRADVFAGLRDTIGIPRFYTRRTRSGCSVCPFQRRSELVGLLQEQPIEFQKGKAYEKLSEADRGRHAPAPSLSAETRFSRNWLSLPFPQSEEITGSAARARADDLFGMKGVFVGVEYFFDGFYSVDEFTFARRIVSYSPTYAGIKSQLNDRYEHLLATSETFDMTPEEVRRQVKFGVFYIQIDGTEFDPAGPSAGGYTWHSDQSYAQLEHIIGWAERTLSASLLAEDSKALNSAHPLSWTYEHAQSCVEGLARVKETLGEVVASAWYTPKEPVDDGDFDERFITCPACSI